MSSRSSSHLALEHRDGNFHGDVGKGLRAEDAFRSAVESMGCRVREATVAEDRDGHFDFHVDSPSGTHRVDVKAMKTVPHHLSAERVTFIETTNVNGDAGWLYGKADFIAFERRWDFVLARRAVLASAIQRSIPFMPRTDKFRLVEPMTIYCRPTDKSLVVCFEYAEMMRLGAILRQIEKTA